MKNSRNYLLFAGILAMVACGNPAMEMPDHETSDAAADSQQVTDSQTISEDADSSVLEEDSSVMENDGSDSSVSSDSSDAGSDSRATDAAREPNVLYRTSNGGYEGTIELSLSVDSPSYNAGYDGGHDAANDAGDAAYDAGQFNSNFIVKLGSRYKTSARQDGGNDIIGRVVLSDCTWVYLSPTNVTSIDSLLSTAITQNISFRVSGSCSNLSPGLVTARMETLTGTVGLITNDSFSFDRGAGDKYVLYLSKTLRVE